MILSLCALPPPPDPASPERTDEDCLWLSRRLSIDPPEEDVLSRRPLSLLRASTLRNFFSCSIRTRYLKKKESHTCISMQHRTHCTPHTAHHTLHINTLHHCAHTVYMHMHMHCTHAAQERSAQVPPTAPATVARARPRGVGLGRRRCARALHALPPRQSRH